MTESSAKQGRAEAAASTEASASRVADILLKIVRQRKVRVGPQEPFQGHSAASHLHTAESNAFLAALQASTAPAIIAEVKLGSPRIGSLVGKVDPEAQAKIYRDHGAAALSVVVEPDFFHGSYELLERCREASGLPAIAKDFIVDPVQIRWAREAGADAVLLIAALYDAHRLQELAALARGEGLVPLIETHGREDLEALEGKEWELVGVNNRDLRTFEVSLSSSEQMAPLLPAGALRVAESGLRSAQEIQRLESAGFRAFLIGESLLLAPDPGAELEALRGRG